MSKPLTDVKPDCARKTSNNFPVRICCVWLRLLTVTGKSAKVVVCPQPLGGQQLDPRYFGFFDCFNHGRYFEAHQILEALWLRERFNSKGNLYKGLIQVAGAFVHLQRDRPGPAMALLTLAEHNFNAYTGLVDCLDLDRLKIEVKEWRRWLEQRPPSQVPSKLPRPRIVLVGRTS